MSNKKREKKGENSIKSEAKQFQGKCEIKMIVKHKQPNKPKKVRKSEEK